VDSGFRRNDERRKMTSIFDLTGKAAIVTGANTGIGQAIALALAGAGADVALAGRSRADETAAEIQALGRRAALIEADLGSAEPVQRVVDETLAGLGRLDILVNNAGTIRRADAVDFSEADWDAVVDTNLKSLFFLCQAAGRHMIGQGRGKIVNIASLLSFQGGIRVPSYTAAKSGVAGLTRALANEWAGKSVNVNAIAPGYIATNNTAALQADETRNRQILERIPAGRWGAPSDIGGAAVFLASPASDYVNGHILAVDGGWLGR
jgi:2-deoxy-D-gluconate 3-dehydrogenase